jgi:hypothetical protein
LNGMLGIFRAYESALTDVEFKQYWGLPLLPHEKWNHPIYPKWTTRLISGFKWSLERPSRRRLGFPSWSWTGWRGKITFDHHHDFLSPDPLVVVWVECREGEKMWHEPFEDFMPRQASLKFVTPFLRVNAMTLRLRFEYLTEAPPPDWTVGSAFNRGPGFYVKTHEAGGRPACYSPLFLDLDSEITSQLFSRLATDEWECIVIAYDGLRDKENQLPTVLVCEWEGQIASRIGLVSLSMGVLDTAYVDVDVVPGPFNMAWRQGIRLR